MGQCTRESLAAGGGLVRLRGHAAEREQHIAALVDVIITSVAAGRAKLLSLHRSGQIDDDTLRNVERSLDLEEYSAVSRMT